MTGSGGGAAAGWPDPWPAPRAHGPVSGTVRLPGSKSLTNRLLLLAALAPGTSVLRHPLRSRDTLLMLDALDALGYAVTDRDDAWEVTGTGGPVAPRAGRVDVGNAGTVARFLPAVAALGTGDVVVDGDPRMRERPLGPLLAALRALGAEVDDDGRGGAPFTVRGRGAVRGGEVEVDASSSSQLVSGLLLAAPRFERGVTVRHSGPPVPSTPHLRMTAEVLREAGADVETDDATRWTVAPGPLRPRDVDVEPDLSTAAAFLAAAVVTGGTVTVPGWPATTTQPGAALPGLLERAGATTSLDADGLHVTGPDRVTGFDVDLRDVGELAPVLTAVAALAATPSRITGIAHLRLQETDRLAALATEITALGGDVREHPDGLEVFPRPLRGGTWSSYADHRIAMAGAVVGLAVDGVAVADVATTGKTVPRFPDLWSQLVEGR